MATDSSRAALEQGHELMLCYNRYEARRETESIQGVCPTGRVPCWRRAMHVHPTSPTSPRTCCYSGYERKVGFWVVKVRAAAKLSTCWSRSNDLWVMSPTRFLCAKVLGRRRLAARFHSRLHGPTRYKRTPTVSHAFSGIPYIARRHPGDAGTLECAADVPKRLIIGRKSCGTGTSL
jgi:hypothetical protein